MVFIRSKTVKGRRYYYLVKSIRKAGKVRQKFLQYLGSREPSDDEVRRLVKKHTNRKG